MEGLNTPETELSRRKIYMRLVQFSVTNFRSITKAHKIKIDETTIIIGKNNEGKSNLLNALSTSMGILTSKEERFHRSNLYYDRRIYVWERDFPIALQDKKGKKETIFNLEFSLDENEIEEFREEIKSNLNGTLPIQIKIGPDNQAKILVVKKGRGHKVLNSKSKRITDFISKKIQFNYIPAVRTDRHATDIVRQMVVDELRTLEKEEEYKDALEVITKLQEPVLKGISDDIKVSLNEFLPNVIDVSVEINETRQLRMRKEISIVIDDGTPTNIEYKGDGVKSLAALSLIKNRRQFKGASIVAIEEPESHLHPAAIHQLNTIISSIAQDSQVIISTHNPLFVDRQKIKTNIVINNGQARPAKTVKEIRELLGVQASDNLVNASYVLVVEGEEDVKALQKLLPKMSEAIKKALDTRLLVIESIGGAGNLSYKLSLLKMSLCNSYVLLDNDEAGRKAFEKANSEGHLEIKNTTMITCQGMNSSEFEDCIDINVYNNLINDSYGVDISHTSFRSNRKWSDRMKACFEHFGKPWNDKIEAKVKSMVAEALPPDPNIALNVHKRTSIDGLVTALETLISK